MTTKQEIRLNKLEDIIKEPGFGKNKGLGNEVPYYIYDYPAEYELLVRERIDYLVAKYSKGSHGFQIVVFDLYDIIIDCLLAKAFLICALRWKNQKAFRR